MSRRPHLLSLSLLFLGGCAYLFPSCESIPGCPDAEVDIPLDDGGLEEVGFATVLCTNLTCSDLHTDPFNCGVCDNACGAGLACLARSDGGAGCDCPVPGETLLNGACYALSVDPSNCGGLGNICGANHVCFDGGCVCATPDYLTNGVYTQCATDGPSDGGCVDLQTDPDNCGRCFLACATGDACVAGLCVTPDAGLPDDGDAGEPDDGGLPDAGEDAGLPDAGDAGELADGGDAGLPDAGDGG